MRALVVYESMFGNTEAVARAVADGVSAHLPVDVVEVGAAPVTLPSDLILLVVAAPTHAFGLSRASTRADAATKRRQPLVSRGIGLREWFERLPRTSGVLAAACDTRLYTPHLPGSAARAAARRLRRHGFRSADRAHSFAVAGTVGPLVDGELDRARIWGGQLGSTASAGRPSHR